MSNFTYSVVFRVLLGHFPGTITGTWTIIQNYNCHHCHWTYWLLTTRI